MIACASSSIQEKGKTDFVTAVDTAVQYFIRERLQKLNSSIQFMGEEQDNSSIEPDRLTWILDPVDGTTNLIHGFRHSAISLAMAKGNRCCLASFMIRFRRNCLPHNVVMEHFATTNRSMLVMCRHFRTAFVLVGTNPGSREQADAAFRRMRAVYDYCHDIRRIGAASIELCYVASGRLDGYLEHGLRPWDFAAGKLILEEAGGAIDRISTGPPFLYGDRSDIMASNGHIHADLRFLI